MTRPFNLTVREKNNIKLDYEVDFSTEGLHGPWFLLRSDAHQDNPHCDREMEERHLRQALEYDATIIDLGDLFCAMEGKGDRRGAKNLRPEHAHGNYLDSLVTTAADRYAPYASNWALMGMGNHEYSILSHHETDLTERLTTTIMANTGHKIQAGGFANWVTVSLGDRTNKRAHFRIYAHHGYGGGGPVTHDTIQGQRKSAEVEGADLYMSGHTHDRWIMSRVKVTLGTDGKERFKELTTCKLPTYKDEFLTNGRGYHHMKGRGPKPLGAIWMQLRPIRATKNGIEKIHIKPVFEFAD